MTLGYNLIIGFRPYSHFGRDRIMTTRTVDNSQDVIDSRDVIDRIEELEAIDEPDDDEKAELAALTALAEEAEGYAADWKHGETLIRRTYFVDYCKEMLVDIGDLPKDLPAYIAIDWQATADNMEADYTTVDYDGEEYLIR